MCHGQGTISVESFTVKAFDGTEHVYIHNYCSEDFVKAYKMYYSITNVAWEIVDFDTKDDEAGELYVSCLKFAVIDTARHNNSSDMVCTNGIDNTNSIRDAWSNTMASDTKLWKRRKGG